MRRIIDLHLKLDKSKRIICVSDIHGGYDLLDRNLKSINYDYKNDYLFILGDMINRGENSLKSINYCMKLKEKSDLVYIIKGNHEEDFYNRNDKQRNMIKCYATNHTSLLYDLCKNIDTTNMSENEIYDYAYNNYKYIFDFIESLPDIIYTDEFVFVHSAFFDEIDIDKIIRTPDYLKYNYYMKDKLLILGHYPTANYPTSKSSIDSVLEYENIDELYNLDYKYFYCGPMKFKDNNIILIDGGKGVKDFGQLNTLIIKDNKFSFVSSDNFMEAKVINDQKEEGFISITYKDAIVEVIENMGELSLCKYKDKLIKIESRLIKKMDDDFKAYNSSNYFLNLKKNDLVKIIHKGENISQIKKDGVVGYAYNSNLRFIWYLAFQYSLYLGLYILSFH